MDEERINDITRRILGAAIEVHRTIGPGLLESIYLQCLQFELTSCGLRFVVQRAVPITYKGMPLDASYRIDLIVEDLVVVEIKSVEALVPVHQAQALTYLRLTNCPVALLINFNVPRLMDGVRRFINAPRRIDGTQPREATGKPQSLRGTETRREDTGSTGRAAQQPD